MNMNLNMNAHTHTHTHTVICIYIQTHTYIFNAMFCVLWLHGYRCGNNSKQAEANPRNMDRMVVRSNDCPERAYRLPQCRCLWLFLRPGTVSWTLTSCFLPASFQCQCNSRSETGW